MAIPRRPLGTTGEEVSLLGVGGAHIGFGEVSEADGIRIVHEAIDAGATFLDNAWEYNDGESERRMGLALAQGDYRSRAFLMTKDCAHDRIASHSMEKLEESLRRLQTDHLDLWQLHEVNFDADPERIFAPGGSAESLLKAKEQGKVRYIGFTGHKHPRIHKAMLQYGFPWDAMQMPLNVYDAHNASFEHEILPLATEQGIAVIGMKTNSGGFLPQTGANITPVESLRYVMSLGGPVSVVLSGMDSLEILRENLAMANDFVPMTDEERADVLERSKPFATHEKAEPFKSSVLFEAKLAREANGVPLDA